MKLAEITDAHRRALLDPPGAWARQGADGDWFAARDAGLVWCNWPWRGGARGGIEPDPQPTELGLALLAEAQRIADGLTSGESMSLSIAREVGHTVMLTLHEMDALSRLVAAGLMRAGATGVYYIEPAGRLVLALRERKKAAAT